MCRYFSRGAMSCPALSFSRNAVNKTPLRTISTLLILLHFHITVASSIPVLQVGSKFQGSTIGSPHLVTVDKYKGGQLLIKIPLSKEHIHRLQKENRFLSVTSCSPRTDFDTKLYIFNSNPLTNPASHAKWTSRNDNDCGFQSTVQVRVAPIGSLFVLVTGYRGTEGHFDLRVNEVFNEATSIPWGLDRIDQRFLPLDGQFSIKEAGKGISIYILDSGVRASHSEFLQEDGSSRVSFGNDFVERLDSIVDKSGHGTHVAALVAGRSFGVAKQAGIVSVRVLDRANRGYISQLVEALEWTRKDIVAKNSFPSVLVLSLSTPASDLLNDAVAKMTAVGVSVVTAAGNQGTNSCLMSPASEASALSVGATDMKDRVSSISNWGDCVDIYAPGEEILSAWHTGDHAEQKLSGTSSACPLVAGAIAVLLEQNPSLRPSEIRELIRATGTLSVLDDAIHQREENPKGVSLAKKPIRMLYVRSIPVIQRGRNPPRGQMFLYVIFGFLPTSTERDACQLSDQALNRIHSLIIAILGKTTIEMQQCCQSHSETGCDLGDSFHGTRLIIRVMTREAQAYSAFETLMEFCHEKKAEKQLRSELDMNVFVSTEPWVLDSRGYKYWAAPALYRTSHRGLSTSYLVLIICFIALLTLLIGFGVFFVIHRLRRNQQQKDQEYFDEKAAEHEIEKARHVSLGYHEDIEPALQYLPNTRRTNSELQGDILKNLSPSGVLPTPVFSRAKMYRPSGFEVREDRSRNQGAGKMQTSTSFFSRLRTPRTAKNCTESSFHERSPFRGLHRILSFGPERGAIIGAASPLPADYGSDNYLIETDDRKAMNGGDALHEPNISKELQK